jgi:xylulokinase
MSKRTAVQRLFLGFDSSTQGIKATLVDEKLAIVHRAALNYDADLPHYRTRGGVHRGADGLTVTSPAILWVEALDGLLARMRSDGCPLERVVALSGSGQQHGSVWLKSDARAALKNLRPDRSLRDQLVDVFSIADSPIWMDSSTTAQCRALESALGGPQAVADLTGSRAYERFTGNQIAKIRQKQPDAYDATARIGLVSSFVTSLLAGRFAPLEWSDGSGMNLLDIRGKAWSPAALAATAPDLAAKLGEPVPSHKVVGRLHPYYVEKYGFRRDTVVVAFSGDNPCSLAGLRLQSVGDIAVSLGTSDTMFGSLADPRPSGVEGHIFVNPVDPAAYMAMVVYKNGSLTREFVRDTVAAGRWEEFNRLVQSVPPGNGGRIAFYLKEPEITPPILKPGLYRFDPNGRSVPAFGPAEEARAVLEGQFLSMRRHGAGIGLRPRQILATGGASANPVILRVMSDVFGVPVYAADVTDTASLGAAYRALHGWECRRKRRFVSFAEVMAAAPPFKKVAAPDAAANEVYEEMLARHAALESEVVRAAVG